MPDERIPWPPKPYDIAHSQFAIHDAWYKGDTEELQSVHSGMAPATHMHNGVPYAGGFVGAVKSRFWGTPVPADEVRTQVHIPLASDLAQLSSDLVFGEAPAFSLPKVTRVDGTSTPNPQQDRLDEIMSSDESHVEMLKGGEFSASLGGQYIAVAWDQKLADHVWYRTYAADAAIPEWRYGRLAACTLWTEYHRTSTSVYRLLEKHTPGAITYSLWFGQPDVLGQMVDIRTLDETKHLATIMPPSSDDRLGIPEGGMDLAVTVPTGTQKLTVQYAPNMFPQRQWRKDPALSNLGRSDFSGTEQLMDTADRLWSSLIRDFEIGVGRISVPEDYLTNLGAGKGAFFDMNRTVYSGLNILDAEGRGVFQATQFLIRVQDHLQGIDGVVESILRSTGYSAGSFGQFAQTGITATEVVDRNQASERTRDKKILYVKPALGRISQAAMEIDGLLYRGKGGGPIDVPDVIFPPASQQDPEKIARTIQMLDAARAITMFQKQKLQHPEWDNERIDQEVKTLRDEGVTDPATFG